MLVNSFTCSEYNGMALFMVVSTKKLFLIEVYSEYSVNTSFFYSNFLTVLLNCVQYLWNAHKSKFLRQQRQVGEADPLSHWVVNGTVAKVNLWEVELHVWRGHDCVDNELDRLHLKPQTTNRLLKSFAAEIISLSLIWLIRYYFKNIFIKNIYLWLRWLCVNFSTKVNMKY